MKPVIVAMILSFSGLSLSCQTMEEEKKWPALYEKYDLYASELRQAVDRGEMTVTEAEALRQEAYKGYLKELEKEQIRAEYRNY